MTALRPFVWLLALSCTALHAQYEVSSWRDHFPYGEAQQVMVAGDDVVGRTDFALFTIDTASYEVQRLVKGQGLTQGKPSAMAYDPVTALWVIGYDNGGVDLKDAWGVTHLPDLRIAQVVGTKRIQNIVVYDGQALLSTGVGVVVVDLAKREIADTWKLSPSDMPVQARCVVQHEDRWLVGTDGGVFAGAVNDPFLANPDQWSLWEGAPELGPVLELQRFGGLWWMATETQEEGHAVVWRGNASSPWAVVDGWDPDGLEYGGMASGRWVLEEDGSRSQGMLLASCCQTWGFDADGSPVEVAPTLPDYVRIHDVAFLDSDPQGRAWLASRIGGVVTWVPNPTAESIPPRGNKPQGPPHANVRRMDCWNDNLWVATGAVSASWTPQYRADGALNFTDNDWLELGLPESQNDIEGIRDILDVSIDPTDPSHVVLSSYEEGLIEVRDGQVVQVLNADNSSLQLSGVGGAVRSAVGGIDFDRQGNLWFTNPWVNTGLHVLLPDGTTVAMDLGDTGQDLLFSDVEVTGDGYVWVVLPRGKGVLVYDPAGTPESPQDDRWTILTATPGQGGLPSNDVFCIEEDLDDEIWVGTAQGPAVFYQSATVFDDVVNASQILISQDGNLQYLLENEVVQSLIIDAGNRKWVGTQGSGVYVLSADGLTTDHHFTVDNSPLPDNDIQDIAMDYGSGEVYLATGQGLLSYRGEATNWDRDMGNVRVMPNPIRADHTGPVVFDGLAYNSTVHITDVSGIRVAVLESNGGRATWDGNLDNGSPAPYGVYLAFATDSQGKKGDVVKFAVLR